MMDDRAVKLGHCILSGLTVYLVAFINT